MAAFGTGFGHHGLAGAIQAHAEFGQFVGVFRLNAQVVDAGAAAAGGDGEVHPWVFQHPLGVFGLMDGGLGGEQSGVEAHAGVDVVDGKMHVETFHGLAPGLRGPQADAGPQSTVPAQQFSVR